MAKNIITCGIIKQRNKAWREVLSLCLVSVFLIISEALAHEGFAQKYQAYQQDVRSGKAALARKDYLAAIDNYTKAIELEPENKEFRENLSFDEREKMMQ